VSEANRHDLLVGAFGFLLTVGALAGAGAILIFALALSRGGGAVPGRWLVLLMVACFGVAVIVASLRSMKKASARRSLTVGIAGAGIVITAASAVRTLRDIGGVGTVDLLTLFAGVTVVVASPWVAALAERWHLIDRFAAIGVRAAETAPDKPDTIGATEWVAVLIGLVLLIGALAYVLPTGTLGHDESVYATQARFWLDGSPNTGVGVYRPVGMPMVAWGVLQFSESEVALRVVATLIGLGAVATMWAIGRIMLGSAAALLGTATFAVSESYLRRANEFLNDLAAAGLLLATLFAIWLHFERRPGRWWLLTAAPIAAAAYYMRYGSAFGLVVIAVVGGAIWWRSLRDSWRQIAATAGILGMLLLPHLWYSQRLTGSPLGVIRASRDHAGGSGGLGLDDYVEWFPEVLTGTFGAILIVAGIVYTILLAIEARRDARLGAAARTSGFLTLSAVGMTILLGLFTHGEPRFIFMPMMALLLVGGRAAAVLLEQMPGRSRQAGIAALVLLLGYALVSGAGQMHNRMERVTTSRDVVAESSELVRHDAGAGSCTVYAAQVPQVTWYSACATYKFGEEGPIADANYLVVFAEARQPTKAQLEALLAGTSNLLAVVPDDGGPYGDGHVFDLGGVPEQ